MKKAVCLLLVLLLLPVSVLATTWTDPEWPDWPLTVFEGDFPISDRLPETGAQVIRGAYAQSSRADDDFIPTVKALLMMEKDGQYSLAGLMWRQDQPGADFQDFGNLGLTLDANSQINVGWRKREVCFSLTVGRDTWEFLSIASTGQWMVAGYSDGTNPPIRWDHMGYFYAGDNKGYYGDLEHSYPACVCLDLAYLTDLSIYPKTEQEMTALAQSSFDPFQGWAVIFGANLRTRPTGRSDSLGKLQVAVLAKIVSQQSGNVDPWYQVRIGDLEGWVSGSYVCTIQNDPCMYTLSLQGLQHGSLSQECGLYSSPNGQMKQGLSAGQPVQILLRRNDGWLYVTAPKNGDPFFMDTSAPMGWIQEQE